MVVVVLGALLMNLTWLEVDKESLNEAVMPRGVPEKSLKEKYEENQATFYNRILLLPESHSGLSNQMACLNLAAVLAKQYNRTLVIPANGCSNNKGHHMLPIRFERVYDMQLSSERIPFQFDRSGAQQITKGQSQKVGKQIPDHCRRSTIEFSPFRTRIETLGQDPNQTEECIMLACTWVYLHFAAPPDIFPHVDQVFFPYNAIYRQAALDVISSIKKKVVAQENDETKSTFRLLTLHVRRGDRSTVPLINCSDLGDLYPHISVTNFASVGCSSEKKTDDDNFWEHALTWDRFFEHMADPHCNLTFPVCSGDYAAIFVATNDPTWVRNTANQTKLPPLFLLGDFPSVKDNLLPGTLQLPRPEESAEMLLIEEMIMVLSDMIVPSFPSTITMQVLRLRIDAHENQQKEWAEHLRDTHYDFQARSFQKRFAKHQ
jgi:hypothetical protein